MRNCVFRAAIIEIVNRHGEVFGEEIVKELAEKGITTNTKKVGAFARYRMHRSDLLIVRIPFHGHSSYRNLYRSL